VTKEMKEGNLIYILKSGECVVKKMVAIDRRGSSMDGRSSTKLAAELESLNRQASGLHQADMLTICSLQKGSTIGEECLYPESRYFYTVTVKSFSATFLVLNKSTCKADLENQITQLGLYLQRKFMQKK
jgi:hypothetical protein